MLHALSGLVTNQDREEKKEKEPSIFDGSPDDESNNKSNYKQHDHQDAHLLPGAPLGRERAQRLSVNTSSQYDLDFNAATAGFTQD